MKPPEVVTLTPGKRVLFLTKDPDLIRRQLSGELDLRIRDVTAPGSPVVVYNGKVDALSPVALGTLTAGSSRQYEFRVFFPDAGPGAENAFQGSAVSVQFDWKAVNNAADLDPPETTITSGWSARTSWMARSDLSRMSARRAPP